MKGDPTTVLNAPDKMVITQTAAWQYFGDEDPVSKTVKVGGTNDFLINRVAVDVPDALQVQFHFVGSFTSLNASKQEKWSEANYITYLLLRDAGSFFPFAEKNKYLQ